MVSDVISDLFTRIRNALLEKNDYVVVPHSKMKIQILHLLKQYGFIKSFELLGETLVKKSIKISLKYKSNGEPIISRIYRVSKLSKRIYLAKKNIPKPLRGFGLSIMSTSKGIICGREARRKNVGGELIGIVW